MARSSCYPKDSFDRFGDDLCQLLLTYLPIKERFRYEEVSKQWQRVVYETQTGLDFWCDVSDDSFETILKKCPNITSIRFRGYKRVINIKKLALITKHCNRLNDIYISGASDVSGEYLNAFFQKFSLQLRKIEATFMTGIYNQLWVDLNAKVKRCPNVTEIDVETVDQNSLGALIGADGRLLYRKLRKVTFSHDKHQAKNYQIFAQNYKNQLKSIHTTVETVHNSASNHLLMTSLSQMSALVDLKIIFFYSLTDLMMNGMKKVGLNCRALKGLSLAVLTRVDETDSFGRLLQTINANFKHIKRLTVGGNLPKEFVLTGDSLNACKRLTHLAFDSKDQKNMVFDDSFFEKIAVNFPKLQYLYLSETPITDHIFDCLTKLPKMPVICLNGFEEYLRAEAYGPEPEADYLRAYRWHKCPKYRAIKAHPLHCYPSMDTILPVDNKINIAEMTIMI